MPEDSTLPPLVPAPWAIQPAADAPVSVDPLANVEVPALTPVPEVVTTVAIEPPTPAPVVAPTPTPAPASKNEVPIEPIPEAVAPVVDETIQTVTVTVPKAFKLRLDDHTEYQFQAGVQQMDPTVASHWYSVANGVTIYNGA